MNEIDLERTWNRYVKDRDDHSKNLLLAHYYPLVEVIAKRMAKNLPPNVEVDDLIGDGVFGLMEAIERFNPDKGFKLETYAVPRIRGEMLDMLRKADWVPRALRTKAKKVESSTHKLEAQLMRKPTLAEISEHSGLTEEDVHEAIALVLGYSRVTMDMAPMSDNDSAVSMYEMVGDDSANTSENYDSTEFMDTLAEFMKRLSSRERVVMVLYYFEDHTLQKIGDILGVTESRACQIHNRALLSLRSMCVDLS